MQKIISATGDNNMDQFILNVKGYDGLGFVKDRDTLYDSVMYYNPDIVVISEKLPGNKDLEEELLLLHKNLEDLKIVYILNQRAKSSKKDSLTKLVSAGIYNLHFQSKITAKDIVSFLGTDKDQETILKELKISKNQLESQNEITDIEDIFKEDNTGEYVTPASYRPPDTGGHVYEMPENVSSAYHGIKDGDDDHTIERDLMVHYGEAQGYQHIIPNLSIVSSIKPGTGKSFVSANLAAAIAAYGVPTKEGLPPTVGLIEGDLQNLSIGTLLQIEDSKKNLKSVMDKISTVVTREGEFVGNIYEVEEIEKFTKSCFLPYEKLKNLKCLVGSQLSFEEIEGFTPHHYTYLCESMAEEFDVLIVDTNSALTHISTFPLLQMATTCFYILTLDFNNVRNNMRYRETLKNLGVLDKVKYILNEDIPEKLQKNFKEEIIYTGDHLADSGFNLAGRIPIIDKAVFLNRVYLGTPVVLDEGVKATATAKQEILKIANEIYPIKGFENMRSDGTRPKQGFFSFKK